MKNKLKFDIITIFPQIFDSYFSESIISRAQKNKLIEIKVHNLRDYADDKHKTVDDSPYGGGAGMILKIEPIWRCVQSLKSKIKGHPPAREAGKSKLGSSLRERIILFSAKGKTFTQKDARRLAKYDNLIFICGRYEGVDERVAKHIADEEISIGDYVLTGGEIPAMTLVDSIARLIPGVLGNSESLAEESFGKIFQNSKFKIHNSVLEHPQYTRPEIFRQWPVPKVLLAGNHQKIKEWRTLHSKLKK